VAPYHTQCCLRLRCRILAAYFVYSMDLETLSQYNSKIKFADDTTVLVSQYSSVSMQEEFQHVQGWFAATEQRSIRK